MFLFHIFLLVFMIMTTELALRFVFGRFSKRDSFELRCLFFLLMALYFIIMLDYEGKHGLSITIPTSWNTRDLFLATIISLSGLLILLLILWFDYSLYDQNTKNDSNTHMEERFSSFFGMPQWIGITILSVLSGIVEELIFRYYIIDRISILTPHLDWAVGLSSFLYGLIYYYRTGWMSVCFRGIVGFLLSVLFILTENLLFVICIHVIWNIIILSMTSNQLKQFLQKYKMD
jgi:membrane protease YdiL (CAAX protease family)